MRRGRQPGRGANALAGMGRGPSRQGGGVIRRTGFGANNLQVRPGAFARRFQNAGPNQIQSALARQQGRITPGGKNLAEQKVAILQRLQSRKPGSGPGGGRPTPTTTYPAAPGAVLGGDPSVLPAENNPATAPTDAAPSAGKLRQQEKQETPEQEIAKIEAKLAERELRRRKRYDTQARNAATRGLPAPPPYVPTTDDNYRKRKRLAQLRGLPIPPPPTT